MSGRVRWRPWLGYRYVRELCVDGATVGELLTYSDRTLALWYGATPDDSGRRRRRRRSDAKQWLLARAAGLAEVPRARRPRGWRYLGSCEVCDPWSGEVDTIEMHERNRRRR